ncbi:PEP-CTERM sorting domain-containing protein [Aureliella helgolandensis]|nr:PEP-CTERM sorting domain-containing protein [Aureliella helgolandensis]
MKTFVASLALCLLISGSTRASVVLDFEALVDASSSAIALAPGTSYEESGYQISGTDLSYYGSGAAAYTGSPALFANSIGNSTITLTESTGALFNLLSIDLAELASGPHATPYSIVFTASNAETQSFELPAGTGPVVRSFDFDPLKFTAITSVSWQQTTASGHQFDNINVSAVPEPSSLAFLAMFAGVGAFTRRRHQ